MEAVEFEVLRAEGWTAHASGANVFWYNAINGETTWLQPSSVMVVNANDLSTSTDPIAAELSSSIPSPSLTPHPPSSIPAYAALMDVATDGSASDVPVRLACSESVFDRLPASDRETKRTASSFTSTSAVIVQLEVDPKVCMK